MVGPTLLIIVLNYRTPQMTLQAVEAAVREMDGIAGEVIIVDNDSRDGSFETMAAGVAARGWSRDGRVRVLQSGWNGGYGAGNNCGIHAGLTSGHPPDYVYVLNSDAKPDPGAIRVLLDCLVQNPDVGLAASYIHGPDGEPHCTAFRYPTIWSEFEGATRFGPVSRLLASKTVPMPIPNKTVEVEWSAGVSLMMRRSVLDEIGLFDEQFFLYFEETDLCRRARLKGWRTIYARESEVTHEGSVSTGMKQWRRTPRYWFDSRLHYFVKHHGVAYASAATLAHTLGGLLLRTRQVVQRKPRSDPPYFLRDLVIHALGAGARALWVSRLPANPKLPHRRRRESL